MKLISFRRNFGKSSALSAGFKAAKSDLILTMDGDLQDDPKEIPKFLQAIKSVDLVVGWKYKRKDIITRRISSKIFNFLVRLFTGIKLHDSDCNFRIMRKEVIESFNLYSGMYRYIPSLAHSNGFKIKEVKVIHHKRRFGNSKFGTGRLITGSLDLLTIVFLTSFSKRPLHLLGVLGGVTLFFGLFAGSYLLFIKYFLFQPISGRPLLILALLFIVLGVQLVSLGLLAELITNLIQRNEDDYIIKEEL